MRVWGGLAELARRDDIMYNAVVHNIPQEQGASEEIDNWKAYRAFGQSSAIDAFYGNIRSFLTWAFILPCIARPTL